MKVAMIKSDKETLERLRAIAGGTPISTYLREIVSKPGGKEPESPLDVLRNVMLKRFDQLDAKLKTQDKYLSNAETNIALLSEQMSFMLGFLRDTFGDKFEDALTKHHKAKRAIGSVEPKEMADSDMNSLGKLITGSPDTKDKDNA